MKVLMKKRTAGRRKRKGVLWVASGHDMSKAQPWWFLFMFRCVIDITRGG